MHRGRHALLAVAFVQRHGSGRHVDDQWTVQADRQVAASEPRPHHPGQVLVEVGHQRFSALERDDVPLPEAIRTLEVRNRAAETAVVAGQPVELPGDPLGGGRCDRQRLSQARHDPADVRAETLERVDKGRPVALGIEGHVGGHTAKAGVLGVATERVGAAIAGTMEGNSASIMAFRERSR